MDTHSRLEEGQHYLEKELHTLLREDKLMFEFFQEDVVDGLWYWDLVEPENEWMSAKFWRLFGYDPEFKTHKTHEWQNLIFEEDLRVATRNFELHLRKPSIPYDQVVRYHHKDGSVVWVRCKGVAIHNSNGEAVRMLGCHLDMTRFMEKQQELLGLKIKYDRACRELKELETNLNRSKAMNSMFAQRLENEQAHDDFGIAGQQYFVSQTQNLVKTARRCNLTLNTLHFSINAVSGDVTRQPEAKSFFGRHVLAMVEGGIAYQFSDDFFGIVALCYSDDDVATLRENIIALQATAGWISSAPVFDITYRDIEVTQETVERCVDLDAILTLFFM